MTSKVKERINQKVSQGLCLSAFMVGNFLHENGILD